MKQQQAAQPAVPRGRPWLAAAGAALVVAALGMTGLAQRYVAAESVQFVVFAMAAPALIVLGAPWRLLRPSGAAARNAAGRAPDRWPARCQSYADGDE